MKNIILLCLIFLIVSPCQAQTTRYVSDSIEVPMRAGASTRYKIVRMVPGGTAVELQQDNGRNGYVLVRTSDETQGWIRNVDLMESPGALERLAKAEDTLATLNAENANLKVRLNALLQANRGRDGAINDNELSNENQRLSQKLAHVRKVAANAVTIDEQNLKLHEQVVKLERELQILEQENQLLSDRSTRDWFLVGGGVLLLGIVAGALLPRLRGRTGRQWGEL
jgi:SH3 domain protein